MGLPATASSTGSVARRPRRRRICARGFIHEHFWFKAVIVLVQPMFVNVVCISALKLGWWGFFTYRFTNVHELGLKIVLVV